MLCLLTQLPQALLLKHCTGMCYRQYSKCHHRTENHKLLFSFSFTFTSSIYQLPPTGLLIKVPFFPISPDLYMHLSACYFRISSPAPNPAIPVSSPLQSPSSWCQPITAVYRINQLPIISSIGKKSMVRTSVVRQSGCATCCGFQHLKVMWYFERLETGFI